MYFLGIKTVFHRSTIPYHTIPSYLISRLYLNCSTWPKMSWIAGFLNKPQAIDVYALHLVFVCSLYVSTLGKIEAPYIYLSQEYLTQFIWSNKLVSSSLSPWPVENTPAETPTWGAEELKNASVLQGLQEVTQLRDGAALLTQELQQTQARAPFGLQDLKRTLLQVQATESNRFNSSQPFSSL